MIVNVRTTKGLCDYKKGAIVPLKTAKAAAVMINRKEAELVDKKDQKLVEQFLEKKKAVKAASTNTKK